MNVFIGLLTITTIFSLSALLVLWLFYIYKQHAQMKDDALLLARARRSEAWRENRAVHLHGVDHRSFCPVDSRDPRLSDISRCRCSSRHSGIEVQYAHNINVKLESITHGYSPKQMKKFSEYYEQALQNLIVRERVFAGMEDYTKAIEKAEASRRQALEEVRAS